jgi:adenosylcobyric acid synthase
LIGEYEIVVIEGAGSPAEINLKSHDIVNMKMAKFAKAPVILVGDIDKGGVFAWLIGTLELLNKKERKMIKGFIINKFRGDKTLLKPGIDFLEKKTGIKVLGVVPYYKDISIPEEDSVPLDNFIRKGVQKQNKLNIDVIYLPHISNFTDFDALEGEADVNLRYINRTEELDSPDIIIIPGTKNSYADLTYLKESGLSEKILTIIKNNPKTVLIGICGGYQMLGKKIYDSTRVESRQKEISGLGILEIVTDFKKEKILSQVKAKEINSGLQVSGYEIHHGRTRNLKDYKPVFKIIERQGRKTEDFDGAIIENGSIWGTYIHGIFDGDVFRRNFLNRIRLKKGWPLLSKTAAFNIDKEIDKLAKLARENIDIKLLYKILEGNRKNESSFFMERR